MSFEAESSLALNDIPLNIQRNNNSHYVNNKHVISKVQVGKVISEKIGSKKVEENKSRQVDERDGGGSCNASTNANVNANANTNANIAIAIEKSYLDQNQEQGQNQAKNQDQQQDHDQDHDQKLGQNENENENEAQTGSDSGASADAESQVHVQSQSQAQHQKHTQNQHNSAVDSRGSSSTDTTSDGSDLVNLSNSKHATQQSNTMKSEKQTALFIGDLPGNVTEDMLGNIFNKFKSFTSVKICVDSNTKKSLGYGYLNFGDQDDAEKAVDEYNYMPIFGREIRMMPSLRNTYFRKNIGTNVFFSNLPLDNNRFTTRVFYDEFKKFGKILSCKLDRRKNIGFIYFENDAAAKEAIRQYNGKQLFDTNIMCGVHFDRNVRKSPEFEQKIGRINNLTVVKEKLEIEDENGSVIIVDACDSATIKEKKSGNGAGSPSSSTLETAGVAVGTTTTNNNSSVTEDGVTAVGSPVESEASGSKLPHPNAVFVKNLPINPNHDSLLNFFSKVGPVKSVYTSDVSKFESSWAFITYKRIQDTKVAIEKLNGSKYMKRTIEVKKAERHHLEESQCHNNIKPNNYKKTVYLTNLSVICNEEFLKFFCTQERIKTERIVIRYYDDKTDTYSGYVKCNSRNDAQRLFDLMENKLLGDSEVKASWQQPKDLKLLENDALYQDGRKEKRSRNSRNSYVYRAPAPNYRPPRHNGNMINNNINYNYSHGHGHGQNHNGNGNIRNNNHQMKPTANMSNNNSNNNTNQHFFQSPQPYYHHPMHAQQLQLHQPQNQNQQQQQQQQQQQLQQQPVPMPVPYTNAMGQPMGQPMIGRPPVVISNMNGPKNMTREEQARKSYSYEAKKQLMNMLKKETKRCIDFLQHPVATRDENISTIASYIIDVYYKPNYDTLAQLLLLKTGNNYYERVFQSQVELAIEKLGLQER
ncbi:PES4 [Kluyveromyces marxianus]|uniref:PES4 n=1 Tax=Kluyveromyces marxianus TaxID=4911 RepID=A0ABX6EQP5_KLUMA|nr:PES4 [Kluyveromyces marxianus]